LYGALISHSPQKNWQSICFLKIPPLIVIKFALVSVFFSFLHISSSLPHLYACTPSSHSHWLSSLTVIRPLRAIDLCSQPGSTAGHQREGGACYWGVPASFPRHGYSCCCHGNWIAGRTCVQILARNHTLMVCYQALMCFKTGLAA